MRKHIGVNAEKALWEGPQQALCGKLVSWMEDEEARDAKLCAKCAKVLAAQVKLR